MSELWDNKSELWDTNSQFWITNSQFWLIISQFWDSISQFWLIISHNSEIETHMSPRVAIACMDGMDRPTTTVIFVIVVRRRVKDETMCKHGGWCLRLWYKNSFTSFIVSLARPYDLLHRKCSAAAECADWKELRRERGGGTSCVRFYDCTRSYEWQAIRQWNVISNEHCAHVQSSASPCPLPFPSPL